MIVTLVMMGCIGSMMNYITWMHEQHEQVMSKVDLLSTSDSQSYMYMWNTSDVNVTVVVDPGAVVNMNVSAAVVSEVTVEMNVSVTEVPKAVVEIKQLPKYSMPINFKMHGSFGTNSVGPVWGVERVKSVVIHAPTYGVDSQLYQTTNTSATYDIEVFADGMYEQAIHKNSHCKIAFLVRTVHCFTCTHIHLINKSQLT
jgi:hypothetical protein